jgi:hypothetical protein
MIATARNEKPSKPVTVRGQGDGLIGPSDIGGNAKWRPRQLRLKKI